MKKAADVRKELQSMADPDKAAILQRLERLGRCFTLAFTRSGLWRS
jgi:hypothetical protein